MASLLKTSWLSDTHAGGQAAGSLFKSGGSGIHVSLDMFFDRDSVTNAMDRKTQRVLSSTGAYSSTAMQRRMRKRKGVSPVGGYPSARPGNNLLRSKIRFGFTGNFRGVLKGVVIGPALLDTTDPEVSAAGMTVPELVNYGGTIKRRSTYDKTKKRIVRLPRGVSPVTWTYRPRPFVALTQKVAEKKLLDNMKRFDFK